MKHIVVVMFVLATLAGCGGSAGASPRSAVSFTGQGMMKTAAQPLSGDYTVSWRAQAASNVGCFNGAFLRSVKTGQSAQVLVSEMIKDSVPHSGSTNAYGLGADSYYVDASSGCSWSFTFTPR